MQIAQVLAGYTLGGADLLRRAMGKKKPEEMEKQRAIFEAGAAQNGIDPELAIKIFDLVEKFAGYGFNKSHSAAYALVSYQTLWLKTHYPAEFMAAVMSADMDNTDKIVTLVDECHRLGLTLLPPDVNKGEYRFTVDEEQRVVYGIGAIKGVGEAPIEAILAARADGPFKDLFDFCCRVDLKRLNRRVMERLIRAGAMDSLGPHRAALTASLEKAMRQAEQHARAEAIGQNDLFGVLATESEKVEHAFAKVTPWSEAVWLDGERETLGLYLTGHPINRYRRELKHYVAGTLADVAPTGRDQVTRVAGLVIDVRILTNKKGHRWAIITLDDKSGRLDVRLFSQEYEQYEQLLMKDQILWVQGEVSFDEYSGSNTMTAREVKTIVKAREAYTKGLALQVSADACDEAFLKRLEATLQPHSGGACPVFIDYQRDDAKIRLAASHEWFVTPTDELLHDVETLLEKQQVSLEF